MVPKPPFHHPCSTEASRACCSYGLKRVWNFEPARRSWITLQQQHLYVLTQPMNFSAACLSGFSFFWFPFVRLAWEAGWEGRRMDGKGKGT